MGLFDSSSSSTAVSTTTTNTDRKVANQSGTVLGVEHGNVTYTANTLDNGAIAAANTQVTNALTTTRQMVDSALLQASQSNAAGTAVSNSALDLVRGTSVTNADEYSRLLTTTNTAFNGILSLADKAITGSFSSAAGVQNALIAAQDTAQSKGTLDNRTITILGVAVVAGLAFFNMRRRAA